MNSQLQPRTKAMQQHARPDCASSRSRHLQLLENARPINIQSRSGTVSADTQPAQQPRKAPSQSRYTNLTPSNSHKAAAPEKAASFKSLYPNRPPRPMPSSATNKGRFAYGTKTSKDRSSSTTE